jgi:hypothetical protein
LQKSGDEEGPGFGLMVEDSNAEAAEVESSVPNNDISVTK